MESVIKIDKVKSFEDFQTKYNKIFDFTIDIHELIIEVKEHTKKFEKSLHKEALSQMNNYLGMIGEKPTDIEEIKKTKITSMWLPEHGQLKLIQNQKENL